jgi:gas vesicle protein GvpN
MSTPFEDRSSLVVDDEIIQVSADNEDVLIEASDQFVNTPYVQILTERALTYLSVGYAVHLAGPAGTGKTTLALHVAAQLGRPVMLLHGDDEFTGADLVGRGSGYRKSRVVDNYIHSVMKTEEQMTTFWVDNRLTTACEHGYTLIYDEFNRSKAEANNTLLSVLAEGILNLPNRRHHSGGAFIEVHPDFRAIFTSNPVEYVGVHKTQDALTDRMITIDIGHHDRETEVQITRAKSGIDLADAEVIVDLVRRLRGERGHRPTIRAGIAVARVLVQRNARAHASDPIFGWVCRDVLGIDPPQMHGRMARAEDAASDSAAARAEAPVPPAKPTLDKARRSSTKHSAIA